MYMYMQDRDNRVRQAAGAAGAAPPMQGRYAVPWVTHFGEEVFGQELAVLLCILITVYRVTAMSGSEPVRVREVAHPRKNGWNCPWHPFQITAWFFIAFFAVAHYGFLVFYIPGTWRSFGYVVSSLTLLSVLLVVSARQKYWLLIAAYIIDYIIYAYMDRICIGIPISAMIVQIATESMHRF